MFLVGMEGFGAELASMGMTYIGTGPDHIEGDTTHWAQTPLDPEVSTCVTYFRVLIVHVYTCATLTYILAVSVCPSHSLRT